MFSSESFMPANTAGYNVSNSGEPGSQSTGAARRSRVQNVVPMQILDLVQHRDEDGPLTFYGQEVGFVRVVGQVYDIEEAETRITYKVQDRSASILATSYIDSEEKAEGRACIRRGDHVSIVGNLKSGREEKSILILKIWRVESLAEVDFHLLSLVRVPLQLNREQELRTQLAQAQFAGQSFTRDIPRRGIVPSTSKPFVVPRPSLGGANRFGGDTQAGAAEEGVQGARAVLRTIRSCYNEMGISIDELEKGCGILRPDLNKVLDYLIQEGHIYCTLDDFHFKSTDA